MAFDPWSLHTSYIHFHHTLACVAARRKGKKVEGRRGKRWHATTPVYFAFRPNLICQKKTIKITSGISRLDLAFCLKRKHELEWTSQNIKKENVRLFFVIIHIERFKIYFIQTYIRLTLYLDRTVEAKSLYAIYITNLDISTRILLLINNVHLV